MAINLIHPLPGGTTTDPFGWRAAIPSIGLPAQLHNGQDWAAAAGTPIRAAHAGRVGWIGWDNVGGGWGVRIDSNGYQTLYFHMRARTTDVYVGQNVSAGQTIGRVGATGMATGNHLHFMLRINGQDVNPVPYIRSTPAPKPTPKPQPKPPVGQEEEDEMKNCGFYYTRKQDGTIVYLIINFGSGAYHEYTNGGRGRSMPGSYNNPVAAALGTGSYASITEGHARVMKEAADKTRQGK